MKNKWCFFYQEDHSVLVNMIPIKNKPWSYQMLGGVFFFLYVFEGKIGTHIPWRGISPSQKWWQTRLQIYLYASFNMHVVNTSFFFLRRGWWGLFVCFLEKGYWVATSWRWNMLKLIYLKAQKMCNFMFGLFFREAMTCSLTIQLFAISFSL